MITKFSIPIPTPICSKYPNLSYSYPYGIAIHTFKEEKKSSVGTQKTKKKQEALIPMQRSRYEMILSEQKERLLGGNEQDRRKNERININGQTKLHCTG